MILSGTHCNTSCSEAVRIPFLSLSLEFDNLKVKTLEEIREEKQLASSVTTPTFPHGARQSYNLTYTPSHPPPSSTSSSSSQTSFKLTSVLKTTGLAGGKKKPQVQQSTGNATKTTSKTPQSNPISQPIAVNSAHVSNPFANSEPTKSAPRLKVGRVTMSVRESSKNFFTSQKNSSSVFSPNFDPTVAKKSESETKLLVSRGGREGREVRENRGSGKANISAITWDEEEEEVRGGEGKGVRDVKKESRILRFQPSADDPTPATKKVFP